MTVKELVNTLGLKPLCMPAPDREVKGGYAGDLLSWVMGRAPADAVWATIMSNVNIVAVAMLRDVAAIVVCEGAEVGEDVIARAEQQEINLLVADKGIFEVCTEVSKLI
ncbi:MAG: hypothetical protein IKU61_06755 [Clostridia bacterium]|nr:hypothetical protein [Clostridia bacterium]